MGSVCGVGRVGGDVEGGGDDGRGWRESEWCSRQGQLVLHTTKYRRASGRVSERERGGWAWRDLAGSGLLWRWRVAKQGSTVDLNGSIGQSLFLKQVLGSVEASKQKVVVNVGVLR